MQRKTKIISYFAISVFSAVLVFSAFPSVFSQIEDDTVYQKCDTCGTTPDALVRYLQFVRSMLDALQSNNKIDFGTLDPLTKPGQVNTLTNFAKQEEDSYLGVFEREGRVVGADIQGATRETIQAVGRDFFSDFARQTVAGVRSSALVRDQDKLEVLDESIDREAIVHINNFVFRDKLSPEQITKLKGVFSAYQDIFIVDAGQAGIDASTTYKDMVGWLNYMQRKMKNHVVFMPKQDFKYEAKGGVRYDLKQTWSDNLKQSYSCVIAAGGLNCNPSYGKTSGLRKEFEKGAGKNIKVTLNKFKKSFEKLDMLLKKGDKSEHFGGYFEGNASERGLNYQGPEKSTKQINAAQDAREEKIQMQDLLDECYKKAQKNPDKYIVTIEKYKVEGSDFLPEGGMGISFSCREKSPYEYADPGKLTEAEKSRVITMQTNMNEFITLILALDETNEAMAVLSAPMDVTKEFPKLSKAVYDTKATIRELNKHSIESCLAFCSNLNGRVNCGKQ